MLNTTSCDAMHLPVRQPADPMPPGPGVSNGQPDPQALAMAEIVEGLECGWCNPERLTPELRRQCVEHLTLEGRTNGEIGRLLRITDRTIQRDRQAARRELAVEPSLSLGDELLGEMQRLTQAAVQRLTRMSCEPSMPPYVRLWAQAETVRTYQRFMGTAMKLGYVDGGEVRLRQQRHAERDAAARAVEQAEKDARAAATRAQKERREQRLAAQAAQEPAAPG